MGNLAPRSCGTDAPGYNIIENLYSPEDNSQIHNYLTNTTR